LCATVIAATTAQEPPPLPAPPVGNMQPGEIWSALPIPAPADPRPHADSPYAAHIDKGLGFLLLRDRNYFRWIHYAVLDYLQRKFALHPRYAITTSFAPYLQHDADLKIPQMFGRMINKEHAIDTEVLKDIPDLLERAMLRAMYCDRLPVDQPFVEEVIAGLDQGGYIATHMILSGQWLRENGCAEAFPLLADTGPRFAEILCSLAAQDGSQTDLAYEAMAFLCYIGRRDLLREEWVAALAAAQHPNGGWAYQFDPARPQDAHGHPTALALWVLLEHAIPDAVRIPWLGGSRPAIPVLESSKGEMNASPTCVQGGN